MPRYLYHCETCDEDFSAYHLMSETLEKREDCENKCLLKRVPSYPINLNKNKKQQKAGEVVKRHIKDSKEEVEKEKKKLKKQEYKP